VQLAMVVAVMVAAQAPHPAVERGAKAAQDHEVPGVAGEAHHVAVARREHPQRQMIPERVPWVRS